MLDALITSLRWSHIVLGFVGLIAWWVPIVTRKGGKAHTRLGKVFVFCGYVVAGSAIATTTLRFGDALWRGVSLEDNVESIGFLIFLWYLGWVTLALVHHAYRVVRTRKEPEALRTPFHHALAVMPAVGSLVVIAYALSRWSGISIILLMLSPVGFIACNDILKYLHRRPKVKMAWFYEHMGAMLGAGVAFHTAFLVFGSARWLDLSILGPFNWIPWVAPAIIGTLGGRIWEKSYRREFGDLPSRDEQTEVGARA